LALGPSDYPRCPVGPFPGCTATTTNGAAPVDMFEAFRAALRRLWRRVENDQLRRRRLPRRSSSRRRHYGCNAPRNECSLSNSTGPGCLAPKGLKNTDLETIAATADKSSARLTASSALTRRNKVRICEPVSRVIARPSVPAQHALQRNRVEHGQRQQRNEAPDHPRLKPACRQMAKAHAGQKAQHTGRYKHTLAELAAGLHRAGGSASRAWRANQMPGASNATSPPTQMAADTTCKVLTNR